MYEIILYQSSGHKVVSEFILSLDKKTRAKIIWKFNLLAKYGRDVKMPHVKRIIGDLFELRIHKEEQVRFLFTIKDRKIHVLHGFKKKKNKISDRDIEIGLNRLTTI